MNWIFFLFFSLFFFTVWTYFHSNLVHPILHNPIILYSIGMYRLLRINNFNISRKATIPNGFSRRYVSRNHLVETQGIDTYVNLEKGLVSFKYDRKEPLEDFASIENDLKKIIFSQVPLATLRSVGEKELKGRELALWNEEINKLERRLESFASEIAQDIRTDILPDTNMSLRFPDWPTAVNFLINSCVYYQSQERTYYLRSKLFKDKNQLNQSGKEKDESFDEVDKKIVDEEMDRGFAYIRPNVVPELAPEERKLSLKEITKAELMKFADSWFILRGSHNIKFLLNSYATKVEAVLKKNPELRNIMMNYIKYVAGVAPPLKNIDEMIDAIKHYSGDGYFKTIKGEVIIFIYHFINIYNQFRDKGYKEFLGEIVNLMKLFGLYPEKDVKYRYIRRLVAEKPKTTFSLEEKERIRNHFKNLLSQSDKMTTEMIFHLKELIRIVKNGKLGHDTLTIIDDTLNTDSLKETSDDWRMNCERTALAWDIITKNENTKVDDYVENRADYLITMRLLVHFDEAASAGDFPKLRKQLQRAGLYENEHLKDIVERMNELAERQIEILRLKHMQKKKATYDTIDVEGQRQFIYESPTHGIYSANLSLFEESYRLSRAIQAHHLPKTEELLPNYDIEDIMEYYGLSEQSKSKEVKPESIFSDKFLSYISPKVTIDESDIINEIESYNIDPLPVLGINWKIAKPNDLGLYHWSDFTSKTGLEHDVTKPFVIRILDDEYQYKNISFLVERSLMINFQEGYVVLTEVQKERKLSNQYKKKLKKVLSGDEETDDSSKSDLSSQGVNIEDPLEQVEHIPLKRQRMFKIPHNFLVSLKKVLWPLNQDRIREDELALLNENNIKISKKINAKLQNEIENEGKRKLAKQIMDLLNAD